MFYDLRPDLHVVDLTDPTQPQWLASWNAPADGAGGSLHSLSVSPDGRLAYLALTAGSFVCNQVFFLLMHRLATVGSIARAGFVHVPCLPVQAAALPGTPSMALGEMIEGMRIAIDCALRTPVDIATVGGATH